MQIVTDSGMDLYLPAEQMMDVTIHIVRHTITLDGATYVNGVDIQPGQLYERLAAGAGFPVTSQPSVGDFAETFRRAASTDPDILCITMSSGLSGTANSARAAAAMVPEAKITIVDSKTLSCVMGWHVAAASRAIRSGWESDRVVALLERIGATSASIFTLDDLRYLIHGGRISHMKGLVASVLKLRPMIGVAKGSGGYEQLGQERTFTGAIRGLLSVMQRTHAPGTALRVQVVHAANPAGAELLHEQVDRAFSCTWLPQGIISPVLGAHTGPSLVGIAFAAQGDYPEVP